MENRSRRNRNEKRKRLSFEERKKQNMIKWVANEIPGLTEKEVKKSYSYVETKLKKLYDKKIELEDELSSLATQIYLSSKGLIDMEKIPSEDLPHLLMFDDISFSTYLDIKEDEEINSYVPEDDYSEYEYITRFVDDPEIDARLDENGIDWESI